MYLGRQEHIARGAPDEHSPFLRALADALDSPRGDWKLTLNRRRRGRPVAQDEKRARDQQRIFIYAQLEIAKEQGVARYAIVDELRDKLGMSRRAVLDAHRAMAEIVQSQDALSQYNGTFTQSLREKLMSEHFRFRR